MDKRYFRNTTNTTVAMYDISSSAGPGEVIVLIPSQIEKSANLAQFVAKGIMEEVDAKTLPLSFKAARKLDVALAPGKAGIDSEKRTIVDGTFKNSSEASVVQSGDLPGEGTVKPMSEVINDGVKNIQDNLNKQAAVLKPAPVEPTEPVKKIPENLKTWFTYSLNTKKGQIIRYNDIAYLKYISDYDKDAKIQKLLSQRVKELTGVDDEAVAAKMKEMGIGQEQKSENEKEK